MAFLQILILAKAISTIDIRKKALLILFFVISPYFWVQGFRIRSDILASFFAVLHFGYFIKFFYQENSHLTWRSLLLFFVLQVLMLGSTPKSIYFLFAQLAFVLFLKQRLLSSEELKSLQLEKKRLWFKKYVAVVYILPICLLLVTAFFAKTDYESAFEYFKSSFDSNSVRPNILSYEAFRYTFDFLSTHFYLLFFAFWVLLGGQRQQDEGLKHALLAMSLSAFVFIFIHNEKLPFFIYSFLWIWVFSLALFLKESIRQKQILIAFAAISLMITSYRILDFELSNFNQKEGLKILSSYLKEYDFPLYYDATGALPGQQQTFAWVAPEHVGNKQEILSVAQKSNLDLVFWGNRLFYYAQDFYQELIQNNYIHIGSGLFAKVALILENDKQNNPVQRQNEICKTQGVAYYLYMGSDPMSMKNLSEKKLRCDEQSDWQLLMSQTNEKYFALTRYHPIVLPESKSFAQIFDHHEVLFYKF